MGRLLDRYQSGDRIRVWSEIASAGATIRDTADWEPSELPDIARSMLLI